MSLKLPRNWDFTALRSDSAKIVRSKSVIPADGGQSHGWADVRRPMEKPLKKGWLKKQRSIVKNWKQCYFVLRGSNLTYHKDDRESVIQGNISLWESQVNELPSSAEDKFIFEIVPRKGSNGDRERDGCVLMAASQNEMDDWVRLIRRVIGAPTSAVFGKSLSDIIVYEKKLGPRLVPMLVEKCADFIREKGLDEEGIFRLPGQENQVKHFREAFDAGERPSFPSDTDVHTVASLLKLYLRELPEPVVPWSQYQAFLDSTLTLDAATALGKENLDHQISLLPRDNYNLLSYICRFLFEVQQHSKVNKMSVENLATVMGVNLFKPQVEDAISMMKGTPMIQKVMTVMIRHHKLLFPPSKDVAPPPPASKKSQGKKSSAPRNFVGWESAECDSFSLSESPEEEEGVETPEPKRRDDPRVGSGSEVTPSSLSPSLSPLPTVDGWDGKDGSPRKRTQTLPSLGIPSRGRGAREDRWSRLQEAFDEKEERTLSEDIFKILDLQKVTLFPKKVFGERKSSEEEEEEKQSERRGSNVAVTHVERPDESGDPQKRLQSNPEQSAPSLGSEEAEKQPAGAAPAQSQARIQGNNTTGQQELITSLQQQNRELSATVAKLMSDLEAERSCSASLKVLLHSAERSRDEALRHNQQLDKYIQEFLSKANSGPAPGP